MDKPKMLSGEAIVAKGITRIDVTLPEIGLKDVIPNGSWLEQKQIQAALEARKHLIEVERIEKFGNVSHATWQEGLQLAEVTQKSGGHWKYMGHNVGKTLYLRPEEALFMMEINALLLKHNDVTVSLQKAYSLLLNGTTTLTEYKVYASLSRLGYRVYRHKIPKISNDIDNSSSIKTTSTSKSDNIEVQLNIDTTVAENIADQILTDSSVEILDSKTNINSDSEINTGKNEESLPNTETISNENENKYIGIHENKTTNEESNETNKTEDTNESSCVKEIDENESNKNTISEHNEQNCEILNTNGKKCEENVLKNDNIDTETNCNEGTDTQTKTNDVEVSMEVDAVTPLINEKQSPCVVDTSSTVNELSPVIAHNDVKTTHDESATVTSESVENNVDGSEEKSDAMEISEGYAVPDSTVETNEDVDENKNVRGVIAIEVDNADADVVLDLDTPNSQEIMNENNKPEINNTNKEDYSLSDAILSKRNQMFHNYVTKLKKLTSREFKPSDWKTIDNNFESIPDLFKKEVVTINVPEQQYIPKNIFVNNSSYVLNIKQIKTKSSRSASVDSAPYNSSDEVNGNHVRRIRNTSSAEYPQNLQYTNNIRFQPRPNMYFRPFNFWRHQNHLNYVQFNMFFQRPCYPNMYYQSRFHYQQRQNPLLRPYLFPTNFNANNSNPNINTRKRMRSAKATHLQSIKNLAVRLKQLIMGGNNQIQNIESLHRLLYAYNTRYKARLRLTKQFEVVNDETIVETIDLEDDDESRKKRPRLSQDGDKFNENLNLLRQLASNLKELETREKVTSKHKRAMSKAIKTFNKSYDAEIYMNSNFEVIDKRHIHITSDSESDCVVNEPQKVYKRKKLRNPFNILKRRTEKQAEATPSTSKENEVNQSKKTEPCDIELSKEINTKYNQHILKTFNENWLPKENDFGRAEVVHKNTLNSRVIDAIKDEYLFNYIKDHYEEFNNWLEAKIALLQHMEETDTEFQNEQEQIMAARVPVDNSGMKPLIDPEDCSDMPSVLEKLRIIQHNEEIDAESNLCIDFDVYNRDVQNFKKKNPPKPHFRIICLKESSGVPSIAEIMALHSKYKDNISIVFAVVGISSISYLRMNQINLPVYVGGSDLE